MTNNINIKCTYSKFDCGAAEEIATFLSHIKYITEHFLFDYISVGQQSVAILTLTLRRSNCEQCVPPPATELVFPLYLNLNTNIIYIYI